MGKPRRIGVIGPGWYGKTDLFRLIQVAPVEVVSLCDVDKQMLARAADLTARRPARSRAPIPIIARSLRRKISTSC
jgi:predicted dehydrogenase